MDASTTEGDGAEFQSGRANGKRKAPNHTKGEWLMVDGRAQKIRLQRAAWLCEAPGMADSKQKAKNPAAVALGRLGGLKGGKARAAKLSAERRREIAVQAVKARWAKKKS